MSEMEQGNFSEQEIVSLLKKRYDLTGDIQPLHGYDEENYLVKLPDGSKFILKISSGENNDGALHGQIAMMDHLGGMFSGGYFQKVVVSLPGTTGNRLFPDTDADRGTGSKLIPLEKKGKQYYMRLLTYIDGTFWYKTERKNGRLYESLGRFLGKMDRALSGFSHPGLRRYLTWDINNAREAMGKLKYIEDPGKRRIADYFILQFETEVMHLLPSLRRACVHNDANDYNVLTNGNEVTGLIDFGDAVKTTLVNNLAIACTYAILHAEDPLQAAVRIVNGYHKEYSLQPGETDLLYYLVAARLCISVTQSAFNKAVESGNAHHFLSEKPAWDLLEKWIRINPVKAADQFRKACGFAPAIDPREEYEALLRKRKSLIGRNLSISYQEPLKIIKGALQYLYDDKGNTYLDCVNNVSHVGHCHPTVVRAMQKQIATLNTNTRYLNDNIVDYARALTETLPSKLKICYFVNSGSEANDLAIRMARHFTQRQDVIVLDHAYHGTSTLAIEMSPYKFDSKGGDGQKPYIHKALSPDLYRGQYQYGDPDAGAKYAESVLQIAKQLHSNDSPVAAFICETLLGVGGQIPLPKGYLKDVYEYVRSYGGVCIADEVQVGFGRVGEAFWGFELQDVVPDIVVMGKPIGNGHPLAAVVVTEEIAEAFNNGLEYFNTFGGNPVSMATGLSVLQVIQQEQLQQHALAAGNYLMQQLRTLMYSYPLIGDVRGHGLFIGVELVLDRQTKEPATEAINRIVEDMKKRGFLLSTDGPLHNVLKVKPPLVFDRQNADELVRHLDKVLAENDFRPDDKTGLH